MVKRLRLIIVLLFLLSLLACKERDAVKDKGLIRDEGVLAIIGKDEEPLSVQTAGGHTGDASDHGKPAFIIQFSQNGQGVAYAARDKRGAFIVHNGIRGSYHRILGDFTISPDGRSVAYTVSDGRRWMLIINGKKSSAYDEAGTPVWSPNSRHVACEMRKGNKWVVLLNGKESRPCESYYEKPYFNADSTGLILVENTEDVMRKNILVTDLQLNKKVEYGLRGRLLLFSEDKKRLAFVEELSDGKRLIEIDMIDPTKVRRWPFYDDVNFITLANNSDDTVFAAIKGEKRYLVFNGKEKELPAGDLLSLPVISPDRKTVVVFMGDGKKVWIHKAFGSMNIMTSRYEQASNFTFSPDGKGYAYFVVKENKMFLIINGKEIKTDYEIMVSPLFSPDGRFFVCRVRRGGSRFVISIDTRTGIIREYPVYERVFEPFFIDNRTVAYGVKEGDALTLKKIVLSDAQKSKR